MSIAWEFIKGLLVLALAIAGTIWFLWRWLKNSRDPAVLILRWGLTIPIVIWLTVEVIKARAYGVAGNPAAAMVVIYAALGGLILAIIWVPVITGAVGGLFGNLYDGGNVQAEAKPFYSIFRAKRQKGLYFEALAEVRRQLDKFPADFEGLTLLASLQAENLDDLPGAANTIHKLCALPEQMPQNIAFALNQLADWRLNLTKDRDGAREALEKIIELLPGTEMALRAEQRIGHLASTEMLLAPHDRVRVNVKEGVKNLGLQRGADGRLKAPQVDLDKKADELVAQLEQHPQDTHAREELASLYAKHFGRLDLAQDQLEQLIQQPGRTPKQIAAWLHLMADLQVACGAGHETVQATLERITALFPDHPAAEPAQRRLDLLKLEIKARDKTPEKQLGVYEQNIGLKGKRRDPSAK